MSNRIPLPPPALKQHPSGNMYFSPQQMHAYAEAARLAALEEAANELEKRRHLLNSQFEVLDIQHGNAMYGICIDAIRERKEHV